MITQPRLLAPAAALALFVGLTSLADGKTRADCEREYTPQRAQEGKDVIWAPTPDAWSCACWRWRRSRRPTRSTTSASGDGKIAIAAGKHFGATAVGVEYDPDLVKHAQCLAEAEGVEARVTFVQGDIFETDFSDATVVALYLTTAVNLRLRPTLLDDEARHARRDVLVHDGRLATGTTTSTRMKAPRICGSCRRTSTVHGRSARRAARAASTVELEQTFPKSQRHRGRRAGDRQAQRRQDRFRIRARAASKPSVAGTVDADRITATVTRGGASTEYAGTRH